MRRLEPELNELRLDAEWQAQKAEGKRRQREYEGIGTNSTVEVILPTGSHSVMTRSVGTRVTTLSEASPAFLGEPAISLYIESAADVDDLSHELADLERDIALMARHETVNYFPPSEEKEDTDYD